MDLEYLNPAFRRYVENARDWLGQPVAWDPLSPDGVRFTFENGDHYDLRIASSEPTAKGRNYYFDDGGHVFIPSAAAVSTASTCQRCGHTWLSRTAQPRKCPNCQSAAWDTPRT